jgi:hypothetical protein
MAAIIRMEEYGMTALIIVHFWILKHSNIPVVL